MSTFQLTPEITAKIARWSLSGDTGTSSKAIAAAALGITPKESAFGFDIPRDPSDFGRCYRLLQKVPELRLALHLVVAVAQDWGPMVEVWDELTALYEEEKPSGKCPRLYERMKGLHDACMLAGGWVKRGNGWWEKPVEEEEE